MNEYISSTMNKLKNANYNRTYVKDNTLAFQYSYLRGQNMKTCDLMMYSKY